MPIKREIAGKFNCSVGSVANVITELKRDNLIFSPERGLYMLNPRYAFKGRSKNRDRQLKAIIELGCIDC